jgi:hypothetical protein
MPLIIIELKKNITKNITNTILLLILLLTETDGVTMLIFNITVGMDCPKKRITDHIYREKP